MSRAYVATQIDSQVYELLIGLRLQLSQCAGRADNGLSIGSVLGLLLEHWNQHTPEMSWIMESAAKYPSRGRPRKSEAEAGVVRVIRGGKNDTWRGHDFVRPRNYPYSHVCRACDHVWKSNDYPTPLNPCARTGMGTCKIIKGRYKSELLMYGFKPDEVAWGLDDDGEQPYSPAEVQHHLAAVAELEAKQLAGRRARNAGAPDSEPAGDAE